MLALNVQPSHQMRKGLKVRMMLSQHRSIVANRIVIYNLQSRANTLLPPIDDTRLQNIIHSF